VHITILESADAVAGAVARQLAAAVRAHPSLVLGLAAGQTPVPAYAELRALHARGLLDMSGVRTFNADEFVGLTASHPGSYQQFMKVHLLDGVNVQPRHAHFLDGTASNLDEECERYEEAIRAAGRLDLQVLGLGTNGHIAFNEPADTLIARTHRVELHEQTRRSNAALFGGEPGRVPAEALSMGIATILNAEAIVLIATGTGKAEAVMRTVDGPITTRFPASLLQTHRRVDVFVDRAAAARLTDQDRGGILRATSR
jgi:glucosamine-6-phosphate deaminase